MKKIILIFIITLFLVSCWEVEETKIQKNYKTSVVGSWVVDSNNNYIWYTRWIEQVSLATKSPGRITYMSKNIWDKVFAWELLLTLDSAEAKVWYTTANNITNSLIWLKDSTNKALDEQITAMQIKIESIKKQVEWVENGVIDTKDITNSQIETAKIWLETAKVNLEETKNTLDSKKSNIISWAKSAIIGSIILDENIIDFSDKILWITDDNKRLNDKYEDYLWIKDSNHLKETEILFLETKIIFDEYKLYYEEKIENKNPNEEEIIEWLKLAENLAEKEKILMKDLYKVLGDSIINVYFSEETINQYKNQISTFWTNIENSLMSMSWDIMLWIKWSIQNLNSFESESEKWISLLEKQIELAEKTLKQYEAISKWEINNIETQKDVANLWLQEALAWLEAIKAKKIATLKEIDAKIAEANWWKNLSWVMINNWKIIAPFSWIITAKIAEEWQVINAWMPIYEIADSKIIKIKLSVTKNILENLVKWDKKELKIEWLEKTYTWTISNISSSANTITKKYEIEITVDNKNLEIPVWAMTTVAFKGPNSWILSPLGEKEATELKSIIIPNSAIISKFMIPWVYVLENNKAIFKNIEIIKMWETNSEIKGLEIWEIIITDWKENIWDWEELN